MPIPRAWINGPRILNPVSGIALCGLNPPFLREQTIEILVHCPLGLCELRHFVAAGAIIEILMVVNRDTVYLTVLANESLGLYWMGGVDATAIQGSLYVF